MFSLWEEYLARLKAPEVPLELPPGPRRPYREEHDEGIRIYGSV